MEHEEAPSLVDVHKLSKDVPKYYRGEVVLSLLAHKKFKFFPYNLLLDNLFTFKNKNIATKC